MPAELPKNIESLLTDHKRGAISWQLPYPDKPKFLFNIDTILDSWKQEDKKSKKYNLSINELINTTPKAEIENRPSAIEKEISKTRDKLELFKEICSFKSLNNNWDGYGAIPTGIESSANTIFIITILSNYISGSIDQIFPNPHGTVSVFWTNSRNEKVSLEIGKKTMSYYADIENHETEFFDNIEINDSEISKLAAFVNKVI
jgi:hypothetical protein